MHRNAIAPVPEASVVDLCGDVGRDEVHLVCSALARPGFTPSWTVQNLTEPLRTTLATIVQLALGAGHSGVRVVVEPTGVYHALLVRIAAQLGCTIAFVDAGHVTKMRAVIFGDNGKTDKRGPRAIEGVARQGRVIRDREFPETYRLMRHWTRLYATAEAEIVEAKNRAHRVVKLLFPDFAFTTDFLYSDSGRALVRLYHLNPRRIIAERPKRLLDRLRRHSRIMRGSIDRLRAQAAASSTSAPDGRDAELLEYELGLVWSELEMHERQRDEAQQALEALYDEARRDDARLPDAVPGAVSKLALARLVGELGPLRHFDSWRQLLKMCGLNLRERKSGTYVGHTKISRVGRAGARHILSQIALPLVKRDRLYGAYYHHKRTTEKMPGDKAMTAVARKVVKLIWGLYRSNTAFDPARVFRCESQYRLAA